MSLAEFVTGPFLKAVLGLFNGNHFFSPYLLCKKVLGRVIHSSRFSDCSEENIYTAPMRALESSPEPDCINCVEVREGIHKEGGISYTKTLRT